MLNRSRCHRLRPTLRGRRPGRGVKLGEVAGGSGRRQPDRDSRDDPGDNQTGQILSDLPVVPSVKLVDSTGAPRPGVAVTFVVSSGGRLQSGPLACVYQDEDGPATEREGSGVYRAFSGSVEAAGTSESEALDTSGMEAVSDTSSTDDSTDLSSYSDVAS